MADRLTEAQFQAQVVDLARICGWRSLHVRRSIGRRSGGRGWQTTTSIKGWPDLFMWRPSTGELLAAELKSATGTVTDEQAAVLAELDACGVTTRVWRPDDWPDVQATLTRRSALT